MADFAAACSRNARRPGAPAQLSSREQPSISLSPSRASRPSCPRTRPHATSPAKSCRCWRAASTAGGARWKMTSTVSQLCFPAFPSVAFGYVSQMCVISLSPDLQGSINRIHRTVELMYSDKSMMQVSGISTNIWSVYRQRKCNMSTSVVPRSDGYSHSSCWILRLMGVGQVSPCFFWLFFFNAIENLCPRFHTAFTLCWFMKARLTLVTTGLTSMIHGSTAG